MSPEESSDHKILLELLALQKHYTLFLWLAGLQAYSIWLGYLFIMPSQMKIMENYHQHLKNNTFLCKKGFGILFLGHLCYLQYYLV